MKDSYIKRVKMALHAPRKRKQEILRDLNEMFAAAREHGESETQLIARLGAPEEFARSVETQLGAAGNRRRNMAIAAAIFAVIAAAALVILAVVRTECPPEGVIGGADAMTSIVVASGTGFDIDGALLILAIIAAIAAAALLIARRRRK